MTAASQGGTVRLGLADRYSAEILRAVEAEARVELIDLAEEFDRFDDLYRTERFGQFLDHGIVSRIELLEYLTLERLHERWQIHGLRPEQARAELSGIVAFWVGVIDRLELTHLVKHTVAPHWTYLYGLYVACRIRGVTTYSTHLSAYSSRMLLHTGNRDRAIRVGPAEIDPLLERTLRAMAERTEHTAVMKQYLRDGTRPWMIGRNMVHRIGRIRSSRRRHNGSALFDLRDRPRGAVRYAAKVAWRTLRDQRSFGSLRRDYERACGPNRPEADEAGRSVAFLAHLQPEASTAPLALYWHDARMVVRELIDKGFAVYYKENPMIFLRTVENNLAYAPDYRPPPFYRDLLEMGCKLISAYAPTEETLRAFDHMATCTGTVGMQAAVRGKRTIAFGAPWYMGLPGVVDARHGLDMRPQELAASEQPSLEKALEYFRKAHGRGLTDPGTREGNHGEGTIAQPEAQREYLLEIARIAAGAAE